MAQKKKKGPTPRTKDDGKKRKTASEIAFSVVAVIMVILMVVPYLINIFTR